MDDGKISAPKLVPPQYKKNFSEFIGIGPNGNLWVEGCDVQDLVARFGSPLYVISENQFRLAYRNWRDAFARRYPKVEVLFANKSNNGLAYRHIMNQEGAGGDCFGINEMYMALLAGTDPKTLVLNGSNKQPEEIEMAVINGLCINIDAMDELEQIASCAKRHGREADVGIRLKLKLDPLAKRFGVAMHGPGSMKEQADSHKWGMTFEQTCEIVRKVQKDYPFIKLKEIHYHLSRMDKVPADFAVMAGEMIDWSARLRDATGWTPPAIDIGGGWTFGKPYKTGPGGVDDESAPTPDDYAEAVCSEIKARCAKHNLPPPVLRMEPGRVLSGPSGIAVGTVGAVKQGEAKTWVNVDLSTNHLPWCSALHWYYHIVPVVKPDAPATQKVDIVGPLCNSDELVTNSAMPALKRGDLIAALDTGGYTESCAALYNAQCRPAMVLVSGDKADITTEREQLSDIVGRFRVPPRLLAGSFAR